MITRLPSNVEFERAILGGLLNDPQQYATVYDLCPPSRFHSPKNRAIYELISRLREKDGSYGLDTLIEGIADDEATFGGIAYVVALPMACPSVEQLEVLAGRVAELSERRQALMALQRAEEALQASGGADDTAEALHALQRALAGVNAAVGSKTPPLIAEAIPEHVDRVVSMSIARAQAEREGRPFDGGGTKLGFRAVDNILGGIHRGNMVVLVGMPKMGKTAFARGATLDIARRGHTVIFYTYEMSKEELLMMFICAESGVDYQKARAYCLDRHERERYADAATDLARLPIRIEDGSPGIGQLRGQVRSTQLEIGEPIGLVIIDYLQIMPVTAGRNENREAAMSALSGAIKTDLAKGLGVPVLVLCQLSSKLVENRADKRPMQSDTRESGKIGMDCDAMLAVHREHFYNPSVPEDRGEVIVLLNRHGPKGTAYVGWERGHWTNADIDQRPPEAPQQTPTRRQYRE